MLHSIKISLHKFRIFELLCIGIIYTLFYWPLLNSLLCIALAALWLFFSPKKLSLTERSGKLTLLFSSLFLVSLISLSYSDNYAEGLKTLQQKSAILLFPIVFGTSDILNRVSLPRLLTHFVIATISYCTIGLVLAGITALQKGDLTFATNNHLLFTSNSYPYITGLFILLTTAILMERKKNGWIIGAIFLLTAYLLLLSIRLSVAMWMLLIVYYTVRQVTRPLYIFLSFVGLGLILVVSILTISPLQRQFRELIDFSPQNKITLDQDSSLGRGWGGKTLRIAIWTCSWDVIKAHPITGVGVGDAQDELQRTYESRKFYFASRHNRYNTHNQFLQNWLASGLAGLLVLIACLLVPFFSIGSGHQYSRLYSIFLLMIIANCLTESLLDLNKGIVFYSLFNSIFAFSISKSNFDQILKTS